MILSIDFGTTNMRILEGNVANRVLEIRQAAVEPLTPGSLSDGVVKDHAGLEVALRSAIAKNKFRSTKTVLSMNSSQIFTKEFELPVAKLKETNDMVRFEVLNSAGGGKEMVVEYVKIGEGVTPSGGKIVKIRAMAMPKDIIADYYQLLHNVGLSPVAMDTHQNSISKLFRGATVNGKKLEGKSVLLVDLGFATSAIYILTDGDIAYNRLLPSGAFELDRYAKQRKREGEAAGKASIPELDLSIEALRSDQSLADIARPYFNTLADGIQRIIQYHKGRFDSFIAEDIFLFGGASGYKGLAETLAGILNQSTGVIESIDRVHLPKDIRMADFVNAAGAMIRLE